MNRSQKISLFGLLKQAETSVVIDPATRRAIPKYRIERGADGSLRHVKNPEWGQQPFGARGGFSGWGQSAWDWTKRTGAEAVNTGLPWLISGVTTGPMRFQSGLHRLSGSIMPQTINYFRKSWSPEGYQAYVDAKNRMDSDASSDYFQNTLSLTRRGAGQQAIDNWTTPGGSLNRALSGSDFARNMAGYWSQDVAASARNFLRPAELLFRKRFMPLRNSNLPYPKNAPQG